MPPSAPPFKRVLIANRGEIACRIERACHALGCQCVAVYVQGEEMAPHIKACDNSLLIGSGVRAYLDVSTIVKAAVDSGCDALHPGYGFLSESWELAEACGKAGVKFIGPSPSVLRAFGDKTAARNMAIRSEVPVSKGTGIVKDVSTCESEVSRLGLRYPVVVKAVGGGGGRGMRVVSSSSGLKAAFERCTAEALASFGNGDVFVEEWWANSKHIEVQVLGDTTGHVSHAYTRDCSVQLRNQKVVEIAPPQVDIPEGILKAACGLAKVSGYVTVGTVEFLMAKGGKDFIFLEVNPRIQVEHTVTEEAFGIDLVQTQMKLAAGEALKAVFPPSPPSPIACAIQARVVWTPAPGGKSMIDKFSVPRHISGLRVDHGIVQGQRLSLEFDPLLVKVIGVGKDWTEALECVVNGLKAMVLEGPGMRTNVPRLLEILSHKVFAERQEDVFTSFLSEHMTVSSKQEKPKDKSPVVEEVAICAPMAGGEPDATSLSVGDEDVVVVLESMKTQTEIAAPSKGEVVSVQVNKGDQVGEDQTLVTITAAITAGTQQSQVDEEGESFESHPVPQAVAIGSGGSGRSPSSMWLKEVSHMDRESGAKGRSHHNRRAVPGVLMSKLSPESAVGKRNTEHMEGVCRSLEQKLAEVSDVVLLVVEGKKGGSAKAVQLHRSRGKLLARERVDLLIDHGTEFLELSALAAYGMYDKKVHKGAIVIGIGIIHGVECLIVSNESTIKGGTMFPIGVKKNLRAQHIAESLHLPCIYFVDSGGAFLPLQADVFPETGGRGFCNQARMSSMGIPQLACVCGMSTAGGAYIPAMCDEMIMVKEQGTIYLAGPPLVKAATGEEVGPQELGGAEMHTTVSGVADNMAADEKSAIKTLRGMVDTHTMGDTLTPTRLITSGPPSLAWSPPLVSPSTMLCIVPAPSGPTAGTVLATINAYEVLVRILDGSRFHEFKPRFGTTLVCGMGRICGGPLTGFLANHLGGPLTSQAALKATHFLMICEQRRMPVVFLQNIAGFMVGKNYERQGITKDGAKMVRAVSCLTVPKITIIIGGSHGAGNYAMAGRAYDPEFLFMWPNAQISVMGAAQAAHVLTTVSGKKDPKELKALQDAVTKKYLAESSCYYSTARIWDDGVIDPRDTRKVLAMCLSLCERKLEKQKGSSERNNFGVFRM